MDDRRLRHEIYRTFARTGRAPSSGELASWAGGAEQARAALRRLHDARAVVLDGDGSILMALPFSAVPTDHRVRAGGRSWWANCAWDALAIPAALSVDATIDAGVLDDGRLTLTVLDGRLVPSDGFVHFVVPARHWWDDVVET